MLESIGDSAFLGLLIIFFYSAKFREILIKIGAKFDENIENYRFFAEFRSKKKRKRSAKFCSNFEMGAVQRIATLVVLEKS